MQTLVCIPCLLTGGTEIQTLSLVEALVAAGHRVAVACYFEHAPAMVERYRLAGADVRLLSPTGSRTQGLGPTARHLWRGLRTLVRELRPQVAHVQYMAPGAMPILLLRALGVKRIIATAHTAGDIYSPLGLRQVRFLSRVCLTAFQCITERAERSFFGSSALFDGTTLPRHFTIYNNLPAHISIISAPRPPHGADSPLTIGVVSRLESIKGMDLVIPAFAMVAHEHPEVRLLVVGDGSQRPLMERQAAECGLAHRIEFAGRQPQAELSAWYDRIDILLMPSRSEGFGLTAIEGMARGCVPVVADTGGLPEVVTTGSGLLHRPGNPSDIARCLRELLESAPLLASLSAGALSRAATFSAQNYRRSIAQLYSLVK